MRLSVDFHENFVQMPLPVRIRPHLLDSFATDFSGKHRAKSIPSISNGFVADINAALVQKIFDVPQ
jgi:hypothetical protein